MRGWCAAVCAWSLAACSFVGVRAPDPPRACTDNYGMVVLDSVGAGVSVTLTSLAIDALAATKADDPTSKAVMTPVSILLGALSLLYLSSDTYGIVNVTRCRAGDR